MKKVTIPIDRQFIKGTLFYPEIAKPKNPAVIFIPGWTSDETGYKPRAEALIKLGYICLTISLRGHGESFGKMEDFSRKDHIQDAVAAYDFLAKQKELDINSISVVGASYGGYIGALLAEKRDIHNLAMRAPALYLNSDFDMHTSDLVQDEESFFQNIEPEQDNFALAGVQKTSRVLLIESQYDHIIPHKIFELYIQVINKTKLTHVVIKDANHQLSEEKWKQEFIEHLVRWFKQ